MISIFYLVCTLVTLALYYFNLLIDNFQDVPISTRTLQDVDNINSTKYVINNGIENVMKMIEDLQREISNLRKQQGQVKETDYSTKYTEVKDDILGLYSIIRDIEKRLDSTTNNEKHSF